MRTLLFTTLSILVLILAVFVFFFLPVKKAPSTPPPIALPTKIPIQSPQLTLPPTNNIPPVNKEGIIKLLPVVTTEYNIEYFTTTDTFIITVKESPYEENQLKATDWFAQQGVTDISKLRLIYTKYRWVQ